MVHHGKKKHKKSKETSKEAPDRKSHKSKAAEDGNELRFKFSTKHKSKVINWKKFNRNWVVLLLFAFFSNFRKNIESHRTNSIESVTKRVAKKALVVISDVCTRRKRWSKPPNRVSSRRYPNRLMIAIKWWISMNLNRRGLAEYLFPRFIFQKNKNQQSGPPPAKQQNKTRETANAKKRDLPNPIPSTSQSQTQTPAKHPETVTTPTQYRISFLNKLAPAAQSIETVTSPPKLPDMPMLMEDETLPKNITESPALNHTLAANKNREKMVNIDSSIH